jgi:hypothetical protein
MTRMRNILKASSVVLILCGGSVIGAEQHNYKTMREIAGAVFYTYEASKVTASDLAAGLTGTVTVQFRGCNVENNCAAIASTASSINTTVVLLSLKNGVIGFFLDTDAVGYVVKGPAGEQLAYAVVPTEVESMLLQIKQDALGGKLRVLK